MELNNTKSKNEDLAYKILADVSNLDVKLMWDRTNVILILQGALLAFLGSGYNSDNFVLTLSIIVFGLITSFLWWRITKGGSFWVSHWEEKMRSIEQITFGDKINIYRYHPSDTQDSNLKKRFREQGYRSTRRSLLFIALLMNFIWIFLLLYNVIFFFQTLK